MQSLNTLCLAKKKKKKDVGDEDREWTCCCLVNPIHEWSSATALVSPEVSVLSSHPAQAGRAPLGFWGIPRLCQSSCNSSSHCTVRFQEAHSRCRNFPHLGELTSICPVLAPGWDHSWEVFAGCSVDLPPNSPGARTAAASWGDSQQRNPLGAQHCTWQDFWAPLPSSYHVCISHRVLCWGPTRGLKEK